MSQKIFGDLVLDSLKAVSALATDSNGKVIEGTPAVADHGALTGLTDDDHPQYAVIDGSRASAISSQSIVYSGDFVSTVTVGTRVTTYTNDGTNYTSWTDGTYTWTPTYTDGKLTAIGVT